MLTFVDFFQRPITALAAKFPAQSHIGIASRNRAEWFMTDLACQLYSFVTVPLHFAAKDDDAAYIINNANVKVNTDYMAIIPFMVILTIYF